MKSNKRMLVLLSMLAAVALTGCNRGEMDQYAGVYKSNNQTANLLGIVKVEKGTYKDIPEYSMRVSSDEIGAKGDGDFSGNRVSLLWGLIQYTDY